MGGFPRSAALAAAIAFVSSAYTTAARADDPVVSKTPAAATEPQWPTPAISPLPFAPPTDPCKDEWDWLATQCQLTWYGIRLYGIYDVGVGYQTAGAPFNGSSPFGTTYLIHRINLRPTWTLAPNALSNSELGVQAYEPFAPDWAFVFDYSFYYDPYSLQFENGIGSMYQNRGLPLALQTSKVQGRSAVDCDVLRDDQWERLKEFVPGCFKHRLVVEIYGPSHEDCKTSL